MTSYSRSKFGSRTEVTLVGLLLCSCSLNIVQRLRSISLEKALDEAREAQVLSPGAAVPPVRGTDMNGNRFEIGFDSSDLPTVLYVFKPSCVWCQRNLGPINRLAVLGRGRFRFVGISLSSRPELAQYIRRTEMKFPVLGEVSDETRWAYRLSSTPETIVISKAGKVERVWDGAYSEHVKAEVESFFAVRLPDLTWLATITH